MSSSIQSHTPATIDVPDVAASTPLVTPHPGQYRAVLADPPWGMNQKGKWGASSHYSLMSDQGIVDMGPMIEEITAEDSFLFLWITRAVDLSGLGMRVAEAWGFRAVDRFTWVKPRMGLGHLLRSAKEDMLVCVKGKPKAAFKGQTNWAFLPVQDHSHKPEEIHAMVDRLVGFEGKRLELFARREAPSNLDWDVWGNQAPDPISLAKWGYPIPADDPQATFRVLER